MAQSFTALGKGNGFPFCLTEVNVSGNAILSNAPTLEQTMNAYWNFNNASWGGASFNPDNEPKDLICDETLNIGAGAAGSSSPNQGGSFSVSNALPKFFFRDGVKYYKHGISMSFSARTRTEENDGVQESEIGVNYFSSYYFEGSSLYPYSCTDIIFGEPPSDEVVGKEAVERTQSFSQVTISGIPFIKEVFKSFDGDAYRDDPDSALPSCPSPSYVDPGTPTLNLHTYN